MPREEIPGAFLFRDFFEPRTHDLQGFFGEDVFQFGDFFPGAGHATLEHVVQSGEFHDPVVFIAAFVQ